MNSIPFTQNEILSWYFNPSLARQADPPAVPYDTPLECLQESIVLTLQLLLATSIEHGRPITIADPQGNQTLFWVVHEDREETKRVVDGQTKTKRVTSKYGFDASGNLVIERFGSMSYESPSEQRWVRPDPSTLSDELTQELLDKLKEFRIDLATYLHPQKGTEMQ